MWPPRSFAGGYDSEQAKISNLKINHTPTRRANSSLHRPQRQRVHAQSPHRRPQSTRDQTARLSRYHNYRECEDYCTQQVLEARPLPLPPRLPQRGKVKRWVKSLRRSSAAHSASRSLLPPATSALLPSSLLCEKVLSSGRRRPPLGHHQHHHPPRPVVLREQ